MISYDEGYVGMHASRAGRNGIGCIRARSRGSIDSTTRRGTPSPAYMNSGSWFSMPITPSPYMSLQVRAGQGGAGRHR